jgi:carbon-monoxide dehydrogenase large subunit
MNNTPHSKTVLRREDDRLMTGQGAYTDDFDHPGALYAVFVRSPYVCGTVRSIDTSTALGMPGVVAVLTGADMAASGFNSCPEPFQLPQGDGSFAS